MHNISFRDARRKNKDHKNSRPLCHQTRTNPTVEYSTHYSYSIVHTFRFYSQPANDAFPISIFRSISTFRIIGIRLSKAFLAPMLILVSSLLQLRFCTVSAWPRKNSPMYRHSGPSCYCFFFFLFRSSSLLFHFVELLRGKTRARFNLQNSPSYNA